MDNKLLIISLVLSFFSLTLSAQDIHFTQFYASPLSLNPANTGNYTGDWRVMNNYRTQWRALQDPYNTISFGYDRPIYYFNEKFSAGVFFVNDKSGVAGLSINKLMISGAYHKEINKHVFHIGLQTGYVMKQYSMESVTFDSQFDNSIYGTPGNYSLPSSVFNNSLPNGENEDDNTSYMDLNLGLMWSKKIRNMHPNVGISFFHLNNPKEMFFEDGELKSRLPVRKVIHGEIKIDLASFFVRPRVLYMGQKKATDAIFGTDLGYNLPLNSIKAETIYLGSYFRHGFSSKMDASIFVAGLGFKNFDIGISYDINVSDLNNKGALEFSIIYRGASTLLNKISIPCDRY